MADEDRLIEVRLFLPQQVIEEAVQRSSEALQDGAAKRLALAKWILQSRRRRSRVLEAVRLGEPTWDMLVDLYVATCENRRVDVSGLCLASGVAPTTAQRYLDLLVESGRVTKTGDEHDHRRAYVSMEERLFEAVDRWLEQAVVGLGSAGLY